MNIEICTLGSYWYPDRDERTPIGDLVHRAKDLGDDLAIDELAHQFETWVRTLVLPPEAWVAGVPPDPARPNQLVAACEAAAEGILGRSAARLVRRSVATERVRDADPRNRSELVGRAAYDVDPAVSGRHVVLVDDVVVTGTTLGHIAARAFDAGAATVSAIVVARGRRR